jgi:hypothetical protein
MGVEFRKKYVKGTLKGVSEIVFLWDFVQKHAKESHGIEE